MAKTIIDKNISRHRVNTKFNNGAADEKLELFKAVKETT